jgi:hypothetical protein
MATAPRFEDSVSAGRPAIETMGAALEGSGKPLVIASGTPALPGRVGTERDESAPGSPVAGRAANAKAVLGMAGRGIRSSVVGLPRTVHGDGDHHGFIARLIGIARSEGVSGYTGDGSGRWPAVRALDAELGRHDGPVEVRADGRVVTGEDDYRVLVRDPAGASTQVVQLTC